MSEISKIVVDAVRNLEQAQLSPIPTTNVIWGENGSGKTTLLEAIHLLASGKSFRSSKTDTLINHQNTGCVIYTELSGGIQVGYSKSRRTASKLKLQGQLQKNWESVARAMPVQVLDAKTFQLLEGGPKARRRFLDWGVFHVEPSFVEHWRNASKCIAQRNQLLKHRTHDKSELTPWNRELVLAATEVHNARASYFESFQPVFNEVYGSLNGSELDRLTLIYERGWDDDADLESVLVEGFESDRRYGSTQQGPHRADIKVKVDKGMAIDVLSRGQQKILVSALKIAQSRLLTKASQKQSIYLVDDLPSELDASNRYSVLESLEALEGQLFITCVELDTLKADLVRRPIATFHVERGIITA